MSQNEYFIRHTSVLEMYKEDLYNLFNQREIAIHFESIDSIDPDKYTGPVAKGNIRRFAEFALTGGYVWSDYSSIGKSIIGRVNPLQEVIYRDVDVRSEFKDKPEFIKNPKIKLKIIRLNREIQVVNSSDLLMAKARRPRQGTFVHWRSMNGLLRRIIENKGIIKIEKWADLTPDQQEVVVAEYLRCKKNPLKHLLMPIGRTLKGIDIYGYTENGKVLFCQVTNYKEDSKAIKEKLKAIKDYEESDSELLFVCEKSNDTEKIINENRSKINFIYIEEIDRWLKSNEEFLMKLSK
ncbi:hypothetical protein LEP1GSC050_2816 [Leptospira broomii serovar Hurstbridge str. 5399]|uniref:Uncharacterized protein n=1 Tax=Leptospira broomii serovar Hurstbridge str. 5399 TaxID=1049789 RepID=T0FD97_9LEPT|nr:hypothetical protein [Leptospira broomii]EQA45562.1 hypothetical protein LEP1GSC050_2816 [Leptospira broomii serovar Hurstbridge str. 5399]